MSNEVLSDRRKALEEQFFQKQDEALRERLRSEREGAERKQALASASGIHDDAVLEAIVASDIGPDTLAALGVVPLVAVAWADGRVERREREAVLRAAAEAGLDPEDPSYALLESWLEQRPDAELLDAWRDYAAALPADVRARLAPDLLARARAVAEAAGGFLGMGSKISGEEERVLESLSRSLAE
ncbi:MAG: hypothetical protein J4G09_09820 [Proteobacteria bacterium]|nr:hypothetical protein [Pseudomonadota bacterium]